ncbi:hypothetical protein [Corynebacterium gerontici]|uniref:hypothetical protein n=1 Tax=Corynebacterium gerontici TaxID=2079234 RepID=UPI000F4F0411|nr:hypothetical protein [Corynebacterium gerontici]
MKYLQKANEVHSIHQIAYDQGADEPNAKADSNGCRVDEAKSMIERATKYQKREHRYEETDLHPI